MSLEEQLEDTFVQDSVAISQMVSDGKLSNAKGAELFAWFYKRYMARKKLLIQIEDL